LGQSSRVSTSSSIVKMRKCREGLITSTTRWRPGAAGVEEPNAVHHREDGVLKEKRRPPSVFLFYIFLRQLRASPKLMLSLFVF
jgi:hypothetical protein